MRENFLDAEKLSFPEILLMINFPPAFNKEVDTYNPLNILN